ncbi:Uncharacterized conserved protein, NAD-dependent epimerase/dehydratase family [Halogranum gelatinilyticum]|uniref:Uncharacterized conserved protein, NAD-dependent epimerase/dehydratase family n=1 Tax=Halogranum gelatinilyticum TaxID=660521 RepID=A0A1G9U9L0_9EURY|nr:DUF1611 domain-containing protein [Halogranum gelatinilyticum]SDM56503.1 Uncharacterized conserved protein, NAD-dependent epimerase/dehydratase family [Halogranum gelatinilyticum]
MTRRIAILAHEKFPERAKTATGIIRYSDDKIVAVLDRDQAGSRISDHLSGVPDAPVVESFEEVGDVDALVVGIAPIGGGFDDSWRPDVRAALERGVDVVAGLHYFLNDDAEFVELAEKHGADLVDVRKPCEDLTVSQGIADEVDADVVLTVGTDCSVGKMTVSLELMHAARERGVDAEFIPTGQTGIMIAGWGNPIDRVVSDFTAGAVEEMILEKGDEHDVLFVEGQGSIVHPAYSAVTCGILHGAMPDKLVLCHVAGREAIHGYEDTPIPPLADYVDLYEGLAAPVHETDVVAGALNTSGVDGDAEAETAVDDYSDALGVPATDPIRFGTDEILEALGY